jgi:hypothetical protein
MNEQTIQKVYRVFDPSPLTADQTDLYVELDPVRGNAGVVKKLSSIISRADDGVYTYQLLAGHMGSGKTTELRRLQRHLEENGYCVVFCEAEKDIDRNDVDFPDILFAIVRQMADQLREKHGICLDEGIFGRIFTFLKNKLSSFQLEQIGMQIGVMNISGKTKGSPDTRQKVRECLNPISTDLLTAANEWIGVATKKLVENGKKGLVIVVDDLDKINTYPKSPTDKSLFCDRQAQLRGFQCHMIYSLPIALVYSHEGSDLSSYYGGTIPVVPMIKVATPPPDRVPFEKGIESMRKIIAARLKHIGTNERDVFSGKTEDEIIRYSGGQPRTLFHLIRDAINYGNLPIESNAVNQAVRGIRREYGRQILVDQWPIIEHVHKTGNISRSKENDQTIRELLGSRALLQYANDEREEWYDLNPAIVPLFEEYIASKTSG